MNSGHMMLVIGSIVLFSFLTINAHRTILNSTELTLYAEYFSTATSVASNLVTEITTKSFDEKTITSEVSSADSLTSSESLGPDSGESYPNFDDIDDYDNYQTVVSTPRSGNFTAVVDVSYVNESTPDNVVNSQTRMKRIKVDVTGATVTSPVSLYYYASY